jgi:2-amino-4-hydroxy-6-hydroxymethyldihydropteridine diphosphokinase
VDAWIGLGANLGDRRATLEAALDALRLLPRTRLVARSRLWSSAPIEAAGPDYLNAVARLDTLLDPPTLLAALQAIEQRFGRRRDGHNAPRTLDLDLLLAGDATIDTPALSVPHPRLHRRAFVLRPMADIDPRQPIPGRGTVRDALAAVTDQHCVPLPQGGRR